MGCLVKGHLTFGVTTTAKKFAYSNKHTHVTLAHTHTYPLKCTFIKKGNVIKRKAKQWVCVVMDNNQGLSCRGMGDGGRTTTSLRDNALKEGIWCDKSE